MKYLVLIVALASILLMLICAIEEENDPGMIPNNLPKRWKCTQRTVETGEGLWVEDKLPMDWTLVIEGSTCTFHKDGLNLLQDTEEDSETLKGTYVYTFPRETYTFAVSDSKWTFARDFNEKIWNLESDHGSEEY